MPRRVFIVSHDAGGAEVLSAWYGQHIGKYDLSICVEGPAQNIFERDHPDAQHANLQDISLLNQNDLVLTSTSLDASHEREAIRLARRLSVPCASFLDHWDLYRQRFGSADDWRDALPDEVWIGDAYGIEYARSQGFPMERIREVPNPYFEKARRSARNSGADCTVDDKVSLLFIGEPFNLKLRATFGEQWTAYDDENKNLNGFFRAVDRFRDRIERVTIRPHPSEGRDKYTDAARPFHDRLPIVYSQNKVLFDDIAQHDAVVGIESMALVVATIMHKSAFSCVTGRRWKISLPHREIVRVSHYDTAFEQVLGDL